MLSYRVVLDVPLQLASFLAERLGDGFGIFQATAYRYLDEAIEVLAARAPGLREALEKAKEQGLPYMILDGKVVAADRCKEKTISRKGREIDRWYSGKAHGFGGNIQALFTPGGIPLWVSAVLPGGVHDITAARELVLATAGISAFRLGGRALGERAAPPSWANLVRIAVEIAGPRPACLTKLGIACGTGATSRDAVVAAARAAARCSVISGTRSRQKGPVPAASVTAAVPMPLGVSGRRMGL